MTPTPQQTWHRRAARLGWVTAALALAAALLLGCAIWLLATSAPKIVPDAELTIAILPVDVELTAPRPIIVLGVGLAVAAFLVAMAAQQTAAAMRVLNRGRGLERPVPRNTAALRRRVLGAAATRALALDDPPAWPLSAIPADADAAGLVVRCTVLIPAHDEQAVIGRTLTSLLGQARAPDRIIVVADNCTDATVQIARDRGVEVVETVGNSQAKAGALNQVLARLLPTAGPADVVLVMDADSTITPDFLEVALGRLEDDHDLMAVGGLFSGEEGGRVLAQMQRNEFARYQRVLRRREGRVFVLTGTASVIRAYALRAISEARGSLIPGRHGDVYDTLAMTEDNEITLALKTLGARLASPPECRVVTEVMPTWRDLRRQRSRWQRGALENIAAYGLTRTTLHYWWQQVGLAYGVIALHTYLLLMAIALLAADGFRWSALWTAVGLIFLLERVVTAWAEGWPGRLLAMPLVIELGYSLFLQWTFVLSLVQIATRKKSGWNYVPRPTVAGLVLPVMLAAPLLSRWNPLPASVLHSTWFEALSLFVGVNTLVFAVLSVFQLLPPIRRSAHRIQARRAAARVRATHTSTARTG
ncbi:glycosyltransferase family 2 protein [Cellulomonas humilata]|uniref:Glycosyltransferase family 2 protein n=1 Tax=Cellulomonas humilata TaxID=144055 RepID=A0A7Y6A3H8_9CELL|nr:glycosyltransferase family 2 protein [Cellulomonas humilata]NUU19094.1 glycosyltransferase family 2 protein [Cellulomonas humilata]